MTESSDALRRSPTPAQLAWVERIVGSGARVTGGRRFPGGITSSVHRLSLRHPGGTPTQVVLKRYTNPDWGDTQEMVQSEAESEAGRRVEPWWEIHQLLAYSDSWQDFIPVQVAGRARVDVRGMTGRVEELLTTALKRL